MNRFEDSAIKEFKNKNVLFITTKNTDYIRNTQEIEALNAVAKSVSVLGYTCGNYAARLLLIYARLLFMPMRSFDAVFAGFAPQLILPLFSRRFKGKLVAEDFFISVYDTMVNDRKKVKAGSPAARLMCRIDRKTLAGAGIIVADTHAHADFFVNEFGADPEKMRVVYLKADRSVYFPHKAAKSDWFKGKFTVLYFGSILPLQGTDVILECVRLMKDRAGIMFDIIGPVGEEDMKKCRGCNVRFTRWLSQNDLADRIAAADLCLAGHFSASIGKASRTIPGKAYIYEAMGKPMILGENPANRELFEEDNASHYYVGMGDALKLKDKILFAAENIGTDL
jgi:glycosyltransferase involved in cell wall biosynthesis